MTFASPILLVSLLVPLAALACYLWIEKRPPRAAVSYPNLAVLAGVASRTSWRRHLIAGLLLLAVALLCVAVARPRMTLAAISDRATVVLVVDVSTSMNATDVAPTRLEAARRAISSFANRVPKRIRIGLVAFSDDPVVLTPPTTDRRALRDGIAALAPGFGTAIGDAVARAVELVRSSTGEVVPPSPTLPRRPASSCSSPTAPRPAVSCNPTTERDSRGRPVFRCTRSRSELSGAR